MLCMQKAIQVLPSFEFIKLVKSIFRAKNLKMVVGPIPRFGKSVIKIVLSIPCKTVHTAVAVSSIYTIHQTIWRGNRKGGRKARKNAKNCQEQLEDRQEAFLEGKPIKIVLNGHFKTSYARKFRDDSLKIESDEDNKYFCERRIDLNWVHKYQIYDKIINIVDLPMTHTSRDSLSSISSFEDQGDQSFLMSKDIDCISQSRHSGNIAPTKSVLRSTHPSMKKINSRLKLVFT